MKGILFTSLFLITLNHKLLFSNELAQNSFEFLRLPSSPRTISLGGINIEDDNTINMFSNPLSLNRQKNKILSFSTSFLYEDIQSKWLSFSMPLKSSSFGVGVQYVDYGDIYTINSSNIDTGIVKPRDIVFLMGYGFTIKNIEFGTNIKYINSKLKNTAKTLSLDIATALNINKLKLSLNLQNFGSKIKYEEEKDPLPTILSFGFWYKFKYFNFGYQFFNNFYSRNVYSVGIEKNIEIHTNTEIILRTGYNRLLKDISTSEVFSAGFGFKANNYLINYSFVPSNILGNINSFSVAIQF